MIDSGIEWTDDTVNAWWGCTKVSRACKHCYAESLDARWQPGGAKHWGPRAERHIRIDKAIGELERIARKGDNAGRPRRVFIASMSDVFEDRPDLYEPRVRLWGALNRLDGRLIPMLLTKRPEVAVWWASVHGWPPGAWLGTTAEDQDTANERVPHLLRVPAPVRFVSCEPLVGTVDLTRVGAVDALNNDDGIHWVITGGESGHGAVPSHPDWFRSLRDQCVDAAVPYFFKQWGEWVDVCRHEPSIHPREVAEGFAVVDGARPWVMCRTGKKAAGRRLDGVEWSQFPVVSP